MQEVFRKSYIDCLNIEKRKNPTCWSVSAWISFSVRRAKKSSEEIPRIFLNIITLRQIVNIE